MKIKMLLAVITCAMCLPLSLQANEMHKHHNMKMWMCEIKHDDHTYKGCARTEKHARHKAKMRCMKDLKHHHDRHKICDQKAEKSMDWSL